VIGVVLALGSCSSRRDVVSFLGPERTAIIEGATHVESYRIDGIPLRDHEADGESIGGFPVLAKGPDLTAEQVRRVRELILDPANWNFRSGKLCVFSPGVALRFRTADDVMDALLCFSCDEWGFDYRGARVVEDSDPARPPLLALAKGLFPGDKALTSLR
jgi:hypothetical protein